MSFTEAAKAVLCAIKRHCKNRKQVCLQMTACFLNCMWGVSKILWNQGFLAFIEMINIQQSNYMLGTNDLLSTEHSPALLDFAEVCNTDLKRKKRKKNVLSVARKYQGVFKTTSQFSISSGWRTRIDSQSFSALMAWSGPHLSLKLKEWQQVSKVAARVLW